MRYHLMVDSVCPAITAFTAYFWKLVVVPAGLSSEMKVYWRGVYWSIRIGGNALDVGSILKKMKHKEGMESVVLNAPEDIEGEFIGVGFSNQIGSTKPGFTLLFIRDREEAEACFKPIAETVEHDSLLWVAYPKGSSKIKTDINRDSLWKLVEPQGYRPVAMVSIDSTWSGMRLRPADKVKSR